MKKMKGSLREKRAFSTLIAALILMIIAVAAGVVVYAYAMGWIGGATTTAGSTKGQLSFDAIYANASSGTIRAYVRNVGGKNLLISNIYVAGISKANTTALPAAGYTLTVQSLCYLQVSNTMTAGYFYQVQVTCKDGTTVTQSVQAQ
jgi:hypothetical protein